MRMLRPIAVIALVAASASAFAAERVRISVMGLFHPQQLFVEPASGQRLLVRIGRNELTIGDGERRATLSRFDQRIVIRIGARRLSARQVTFTPQQGTDAEFVLRIPGKLRRSYRGRLTILLDDGELVPVVDMELETAVASIVAAEMPDEMPLEAFKVQAIATRSYLIAGEKRHPHADFCDTTHCQFLRNPPPPASRAARATAATRGLVLEWKGTAFAAMYSAACGGHTRSATKAENAGGNYPYFAVECRYCRRAQQKRRGHGVGLCQQGAAGMARDHKDFRAILAHYYPNTTIESLPAD